MMIKIRGDLIKLSEIKSVTLLGWHRVNIHLGTVDHTYAYNSDEEAASVMAQIENALVHYIGERTIVIREKTE